jgi:hypothetical protein
MEKNKHMRKLSTSPALVCPTLKEELYLTWCAGGHTLTDLLEQDQEVNSRRAGSAADNDAPDIKVFYSYLPTLILGTCCLLPNSIKLSTYPGIYIFWCIFL